MEVLYRADDIWDKAKENRSRVTSVTGEDINSYYTMVKTIDEQNAKLGLVMPYTGENKQNIMAYLVGTYDKEKGSVLKVYKFSSGNSVLGTMQLDTLIEQDDRISKELEALNLGGTRIEKTIITIPINNTLLYIEPIYQVMINETGQVPILKKVIAASGNKVAIGDNLNEAISNLLSQDAVSIEVGTDNKEELIQQIINANKNLEESSKTNDWELIGKDMKKLQQLIDKLDAIIKKEQNSLEKVPKTNIKENTV